MNKLSDAQLHFTPADGDTNCDHVKQSSVIVESESDTLKKKWTELNIKLFITDFLEICKLKHRQVSKHS